MRVDGLRHRTVVAVRRLRRPEAPSGSLQQRVDTVRDVGNQLSDLEYGLVFGAILARAPANVLVFGLSADSELWVHANRGGRTVFLEDRAEYMRTLSDAEVYSVAYPGFGVPAAVAGVRWDVIFVDGPMAWRPEHPGRGESIGAAATLADAGCWLFVHDYDRTAERARCDELLGAPFDTVDRMGLFRKD